MEVESIKKVRKEWRIHLVGAENELFDSLDGSNNVGWCVLYRFSRGGWFMRRRKVGWEGDGGLIIKEISRSGCMRGRRKFRG